MAKNSDVRKRVHGNYVIYYRVAPQSIDILHILHGAKDIEIFDADEQDN